ncbi:MAG: hypothetical protein P4L84_15595 [Isosphaeraceae bacterium]|nr:hypothetical protein [Isosphaeraceae bacterium]
MDHATLLPLLESLESLESLGSLGQVIRWALVQTPQAEFADVVIQDEYTHDVVVRIAPLAYAVFDTT